MKVHQLVLPNFNNVTTNLVITRYALDLQGSVTYTALLDIGNEADELLGVEHTLLEGALTHAKVDGESKHGSSAHIVRDKDPDASQHFKCFLDRDEGGCSLALFLVPIHDQGTSFLCRGVTKKLLYPGATVVQQRSPHVRDEMVTKGDEVHLQSINVPNNLTNGLALFLRAPAQSDVPDAIQYLPVIQGVTQI
jgi:hypothetical protein